MSLKCSYVGCASYELASFDQIAFYQDVNTGGWNLALGPEYSIPGILPSNIRIVDTGDIKFPYTAVCGRCTAKLGKANAICGFEQITLNFSAKKAYLVESSSEAAPKSSQKWSKLVTVFPQIRKITATIQENALLIGTDTVHFHSLSDLEEMIRVGIAVSNRSHLHPRRYQWYSYFFSCFNNVLLCLPTGMGKTLISNLLMKAYYERNLNKGQVFIVPTVVLVEQQSAVIERNTGLKVIRRSGEDIKKITWSSREICVCTPAILLNAIKLKELDMSQLSLLIFDEVHEANSPLSPYGMLLPYLTKCPALQRPRILGLTASPLSSNSTLADARQSISSLCTKLGAIPYTPLVDDCDEKPKVITCKYVGIEKTSFEVQYGMFVMESLEKLSHYHSFFDSNWKTIPITLSTQNKLGAVVKILSYSRLIAQNKVDIQLYQLTAWMSKWIDSLDILQIFGPRKLIEFIRNDLALTKESDGLSSISTQLIPIVTEMISTIDRLANEYLPDNSQRMEELLNLLKLHQNDQERILIFVDRRTTAERLCRKLRDEPNVIEFNPCYIVGNGGTGTFSKERQQSILEMFRIGESRLLISTSVLEQGIDVATCGLVICFDGVKSLKSIIQSRGRARKDDANFVAFVEAEKQRKANELTQLEVSMDYAIRQLMTDYKSVFDPIVKQEIEKFLDSDHETVEESSTFDEIDDEDDDDDDDDDDDNELDIQTQSDQKFIQLRFFNFVNPSALTRRIQSCFMSQFDRLKVKRRYINACFAVTDVELDSSIIKKISAVPNKKASRLCSWFDVSDNLPITENKGENNEEPTALTFDILTGFYFKDCTSVSYDSDHIWCENFQLNVKKDDIELSTTDSRQFRIRPTDIDGPILINDTEKVFEIFFCLRNPPSYFVEMEECHFDFSSRSFNLCLRRRESVDSKISWNLRSTLRFMALQIYNVCNLKTAILDTETSVDQSMEFTRYYLIKTWHSMHSAVLPANLPSHILKQFATCSSITSLKLLLNNTTPVRFHKLKVPHVHDVELPFSDCDTNSDYVTIGRLEVTPYRFKFTRMEPMRKNRIFRYFPDPENFLLISFSDEHGGNPWGSQYVYDWFLSVLRNGIKIGSKCFKFLGCSNSQLREGRCWFSSLNRDDVYNKIGKFPDDWSPGRTLTRLALAFASSCETVPLDHEKYLRTVAPDVKNGKVNFSDGIGRCSRSLAEKLKSILNLPQTTSAFQIRVGGVKGVISVYDQEEDVMFRESMKKFESDHNMLEVLNYSRLISLSLNRHVILLLSSFGVPNAAFLQLQHNVLVDCMYNLIEEDLWLMFVKKHSKIFDWQLFSSLHTVREPFFKEILFANAINLISDITNHAHIPVSNGIVLMGVMDETNTLEYGEVYAHIVDGDNDYELEGTVVVFRNPSVLPSDLRILAALKQNSTSRLKQLYQNCLVLPSHGPNSHANECSGGDLDGDIYYIIWDKNLIPPRLDPPGKEVIEVSTITDNQTLNNETSKYESILKFYCDYVSKNQLGIIANAHLAVSDEFGMLHSKSVELAKYVTAETDAPKKGLTVGKINTKLLPTKYPDFMQKLDKPSYRSKTVLGELYRQSQPILEMFLEKEGPTSHQSKLSFTSNTSSIEHYYALYSFEIKTLVRSFNLKSEVDLFSGTPSWRQDYMSTYKEKHQLRQTVFENVQLFWRKWKATFDKWLLQISNDQQKIIEWYSRPKSSRSPIHSFSFLAMPYLQFEECSKKTISEKIHVSTMRWVFQNKMKWLNEWRMRFQAGQAIMRKLEGIECHFYGSSMLGLSEEYSDIDLFADDRNFDNLCKILIDLDENALSMKKPHECVSLTFESLPVDVTNFIGGKTKTYNLAATFDENPSFWPGLRVLVEWARTVRIVKSGGSEGLMTVISFCHLFIYFATNLPLRTQSEITPYSLVRYGNWMESVRNSLCGNLIYDFLTHLSSRNNKEWIETKVDPLTEEALIKSDLIDELIKNAEIALYILAVHEGDVQKLFQFCTKKRLFRVEKRYIDPSKAPEERRKQCLKEIESNCNPRKCPNLLFELLERNGMFYVQVSGENKFFPDVEKGLNKIHTKILNTHLVAIARQKAYHVIDATIIIAEFGNGVATDVCFSTYVGDQFASQHIGMWKFKLMCRSVERNLNWRTIEYERYKKHFVKQVQLFKDKRKMDVKGSRIGRFFSDMICNLRCGNHYLFNIPDSLHNTFEKITLLQIEEKISHLEETLDFERQQNVINDLLSSKPKNLIKSHRETDEEKPLELMPLQDLKARRKAQGTTDAEVTSSNKMLDGIRHSFYPYWNFGLKGAREFAEKHGFKEIQPETGEYYTTISVFWRQRELVLTCDKNGIVLGIRHRSTRWLSASITRYEKNGGDDVRVYLECRVSLDDEESCLETIIEYLQGRSIFTEMFGQQIQQSRACTDNEAKFSTRPLIPDIFHLDWKLRGMRLITPVLKFISADNDILLVHDIYDGIFQYDKHEFEWFPKHLELEIRMCMENLSDEELARKSYDLSLNIFDFTKKNV